MAEIHLEQLAHSYAPDAPERVYALQPLDLTWQDGETYALLGPSGCGKTTMLNIISGLIRPSEGRVLFDGRDVTGEDTRRRNIAQVFQVPVIYRSMTVAQNLAFPLVCRGLSRARIRQRVGEIAELLGLSTFLKRPARELTADQKQLISLGRGLVREDVSAILLDEPLTVIDPQMKFELRKKLKQINEAAGVTMVLVTHDQNEAMTFARTVIVMNHGRIVQSGEPQELFECPATEYVGTFIGSPAMNFLATVPREGRREVPDLGLGLSVPKGEDARSGTWTLGFRPEHVFAEGDGWPLRGRIRRIWFEGVEQVLEVEAGETVFRAKLDHARVRTGESVELRIAPERLALYRDGQRVGAEYD